MQAQWKGGYTEPLHQDGNQLQCPPSITTTPGIQLLNMIILSNSGLDGWIDQRLVGIYIFKEYRSNCRRDGIYGILRSQDSGTSKKYVLARPDGNILYVSSGPCEY